MATQQFNPAAVLTPFITDPDPLRIRGVQPFGMVSYRSQEALSAAGAADELINIIMALPVGFVYRLCGMNVHIDTNLGTNTYSRNARLRMQYQESETAVIRLMEFPILVSDEAADDTRFYTLGTPAETGSTLSGASINVINSPGRWLITGNGSNDVDFRVESTAAANGGTLDFHFSFLAYNIEQRNHADLHVHYPITA